MRKISLTSSLHSPLRPTLHASVLGESVLEASTLHMAFWVCAVLCGSVAHFLLLRMTCKSVMRKGPVGVNHSKHPICIVELEPSNAKLQTKRPLQCVLWCKVAIAACLLLQVMSPMRKVQQGSISLASPCKPSSTHCFVGPEPSIAKLQTTQILQSVLKVATAACLLLQVMSPMRKGPAGVNQLNTSLQALLNPPAPHKAELPMWSASTSDDDATAVIRVGDRVIQNTNNYQKDVFNGDIGFVADVKKGDRQVLVRFPGEIVMLMLPC